MVGLCLVFGGFAGLHCANAAQADVQLISFATDETVSRHGSYAIRWKAENLPPKSALSLRLTWESDAPSGGRPVRTSASWLVTTVLDAASEEELEASFRSWPGFRPPDRPVSTIESGTYLWDIGAYCNANKEDGQSVCDKRVRFHLQLILRSAKDPCADREDCPTRRSLFQTSVSKGAISFGD